MSTTDICPNSSSSLTFSKRTFNSSKVDNFLFFLMHPYGSGLVIAKPHWLFSSICIILDENRLTWPSAVLNKTLSLTKSLKKIYVSKASLVFTQLYPPIRVFSKILTIFASRGSTILHLLLFLCTYPEKVLALLHFLGLILKRFCSNCDLCSKISHKSVCLVYYKSCLNRQVFSNSISEKNFLHFHTLRQKYFFLKTSSENFPYQKNQNLEF